MRTIEDPSSSAWNAALHALGDAGVDFLVGGGFAMRQYLKRRRRVTKDLDVFLRGSSVVGALDALGRAGFSTEVTNPTWLAKAHRNGALVDVIFCSYNGLFPVNESWFANARSAHVLGTPVRVVGPEEMIVLEEVGFDASREGKPGDQANDVSQ